MSIHALPRRVQRKIRVDDSTGCWLWTGARNAQGYGVLGVPNPGRTVRAHRFVYEALVDAIPAGLQLDHLCRVPECVNPDHLEPVTNRENSLRGIKATATHCKRGHEFTPENLSKTATGRRRCRACRNLVQREYRARKAA